LGAHYTSEKNILRVIKPLFLDALYEEFASIGRNKKKLAVFHDKLASLKFLDPACGCGNFLVITYRELRRLEHKVIEASHGKSMGWLDVGDHGLVRVNVDQMYGIEIEEFPSLIAETAMWLTDHQMNMEFSKDSGQIFKRLPLIKKATIAHANALQINWENVVNPATLNYILGNPPFNGSKMMTESMRQDLQAQFGDFKGTGVLDFVSAWYAKATQFMKNNQQIEAALVSTNSIVQGEQVGILWKYLAEQGIVINFAHRTFKWRNDAKGVAGVYCVIVGFSLHSKPKRIFDYPDIAGEPIELAVSNINPYLIDAPTVFISSRSKPISNVPEIGIGNQPIDGGYYLFTPVEMADFLQIEPAAEKYFRPWIGAQEFINGQERWCLWLGEVEPSVLRELPEALKLVQAVRDFRSKSKRPQTKELANRPTHFLVENIPTHDYVVIPEVSSERRDYIPIGYMLSNTLASNLVKVMREGTLYHFAIVTSQMHMAWVRVVCGRLESRYRYSKDIVYNNFPWPEGVSDDQKEWIGVLGQAVLDARAAHSGSTLADLYDPLTMPVDLLRAHKVLDRAVDRLYSAEAFVDDAERVAMLFERYKDLINAS
jgi:hypothetical protein